MKHIDSFREDHDQAQGRQMTRALGTVKAKGSGV
jgi:hypothetical protein